MGWSRHDEESRADHYRDLRKNDVRPWVDEEAPKTATTALETVLLIKAVDIKLAVELIDAYADAKAAAIRLDAIAAGAQP